jgi:hypothetical protein
VRSTKELDVSEEPVSSKNTSELVRECNIKINAANIVAYRPVVTRWLCEQQPLPWNARSLRVRSDVTQQQKR